MKRFRPLIALAGAATLAVAGPALAHTRLVSSNPAANATVSSPRTITLTIVDDAAPEPEERFTVTLGNPLGGATLALPATATVAIAASDSVLMPPPEMIPASGSRALWLLMLAFAGVGLFAVRGRA